MGFEEITFTLSTINLNKYIDNENINIKAISKNLINNFFEFMNNGNFIFNIDKNLLKILNN